MVGGKLGRLRHRGRTFRFDTGPSLLTLPQVFADLFARPGDAGARDLVPLDPIVRHASRTARCSTRAPTRRVRRPDRRRVRAGGRRRLAAPVAAGRAGSGTPPGAHILRAPVDSPRSLARLAWRLGDLAAIAPGRTLRGLGRRHLRDPRLRMLLDRYATYTGADPRRAPAALVAIPYAELTFGGWYLPGGLATLADALLARCVALGVTVAHRHAGQPDRRRRRPGARRPPGRRRHGRAADVVVANVDALHVYRDLLPTPAPAGPARPTAAWPASCCCSASRGATPGLAHHTVFFPADYDAEFDAVFGDPAAARPAATRRSSSPSPTTRSVRPAGHEAWFVLVNAPPHGTGWRSTGGGPGSPTRTPTGSSPCSPRAASTYATGSCSGRSARPADLGGRDRRAGRRDLRHRPGWAAAPGQPRARSAACSWSAAPPTRAAGCRWSRCPRRSSRPRSAPPSRRSGLSWRPRLARRRGSARRGRA